MSQSPSPYEPPSPVEPAAAAPRRRRSLTTILAIVGVVLLVPCVCCGGLAALMGRGVYVAATERGNVEQVVDQYMRQMEARVPRALMTSFPRAPGDKRRGNKSRSCKAARSTSCSRTTRKRR